MTAVHCYLQERVNNLEDGSETLLYGPSTQSKIERWWRELSECMERYFKAQLHELLEDRRYDPSNKNDKYSPRCSHTSETGSIRGLQKHNCHYNPFFSLGTCILYRNLMCAAMSSLLPLLCSLLNEV